MVKAKTYPKYKDSGAPWIGKVPECWDVLPNRTLFYEIKERGHIDEQLISVTISQGIIRQSDLISNTSKKDSSNEDKSKYKLVEPGDLAYNKMRAWQGAVGVSPYRGIVSPAYIVVRPRRKQNTKYFHYLLRTPAFAKEAERWSYGITSDQWSLRPEHFKMIYCSLPSDEEQEAIVRFLDNVEVRVRRYIRAKQQVIKLLNEQKQTIINYAVTKGLNCNVRFKPSGVDWIGDIPEHWEVRPIKQLLSRMDYGTSKNLSQDGNIRVLTMGNIQDGEIILPDHGSLDLVPDNLLLEHLDLLFNRTNSPELVGKVGIFRGTITDNISFASYLVRLRVKPEYNSIWLNFLLNSTYFWSYARSQALVSLHQANLNSTRYGRMLLPVPPELEQIEITRHINKKIEGIHQTITAIDREITLIREYRVRLISDAVTGKIDVRDIKLPEFEDITDSEQIEEQEISEDIGDTQEVVNADE